MLMDSVIFCPCQSHKEEKIHYRQDGSVKKIAPMPKVLIRVPKTTRGAVSLQCSDITCRTYNKNHSNGKYNSWYCIEFNGIGGFTITSVPIPEERWEVNVVPVAILGDDN